MAFLGHIVSNKGIYVDPTKIEVFSSWLRPTSISEIRNFLRLVVYYYRFVEGFSRVTMPFTQLIRKNQKFQWIDVCEKIFQELKQRLVSTPIVTIPSGSERFVIYSDASKQGLRCVLMQNGKFIAYPSRQLKDYK